MLSDAYGSVGRQDGNDVALSVADQCSFSLGCPTMCLDLRPFCTNIEK